jgi:aminopeptidase-like protein
MSAMNSFMVSFDTIRATGDVEVDVGIRIYALAARLFPICRSITGDGVRETLQVLGQHIDLTQYEVPTGTQVLDWTVPQEWDIRDAYIKDPSGRKVLDFADNNLHVLGYSTAVQQTMSLTELKAHIHTLPEQPDLIPYRTSYYSEQWGLCMAHNELLRLEEGEYEVLIDSEKRDGHLTYGEYVHKGQSERDVLLSAHICHPSLANDNCSGLALLACLAKALHTRKTRYNYRFLFAPGTIGALTWLAGNEDKISRIDHGLIVSCVGDGGGPNYKRSRRGNSLIDQAMQYVLNSNDRQGKISDFSPYGYDERQYCSPGFNLPVGLFQRSAFGTFPEYHTSADNLDFISPEHLASSYRMIMDAIDILEMNWTPINLFPKGEPQLGRRGLYSALGGDKSAGETAMGYLWVLNLADGNHTLLDIAQRSRMSFRDIARAAQLLLANGLLAEAPEQGQAGEVSSSGQA